MTIKIILAALGLAGLSWFWFHQGGLAKSAELATYKTAIEASHAAQLKAVADAYLEQLRVARASAVKQQGIIDDLNKSLATPDPSVAGLAQRVHDAEAAAGRARNCGVPKAGTGAGGIEKLPAEGEGSDQRTERLRRLTQAVFDAADSDDDYLDAALKLLP